MTAIKATTILALRLLSLLPLRANHALGGLIGRIFHAFPNRHNRVIRANLKLCFPDISQSKQQTLRLQNLKETGKNLTELGAFWHWPKSRIEDLIVEQVGRDILENAISKNKGVILAAPHTGAWELIGLILSCNYPMHFLYRPSRISGLDKPLISARERFGAKCHPISRRGLSALVKALKQGGIIGILPDQVPALDHGVYAPLYGVPTYTMTFLSNLANRTGAPVIFTVMERLPNARGYRLHYLTPDEDLQSSNPEVSAAALNRCVEQCINIAPTQYMWSYKRFKRTPAEHAPNYH